MKYTNAMRVSFPRVTYRQMEELKDMTGMGYQDMVRRALEYWCEKETKKMFRKLKERREIMYGKTPKVK